MESGHTFLRFFFGTLPLGKSDKISPKLAFFPFPCLHMPTIIGGLILLVCITELAGGPSGTFSYPHRAADYRTQSSRLFSRPSRLATETRI